MARSNSANPLRFSARTASSSQAPSDSRASWISLCSASETFEGQKRASISDLRFLRTSRHQQPHAPREHLRSPLELRFAAIAEDLLVLVGGPAALDDVGSLHQRDLGQPRFRFRPLDQVPLQSRHAPPFHRAAFLFWTSLRRSSPATARDFPLTASLSRSLRAILIGLSCTTGNFRESINRRSSMMLNPE